MRAKKIKIIFVNEFSLGQTLNIRKNFSEMQTKNYLNKNKI